MLPPLLREQFPDRHWDAADLDAVAEFWLRLYEAAAGPRGFTPAPDHTTEVRLRGFPRQQAGAVVRELAARAAASDFVAPEVGQPDPDTVALSSGRTLADEQPPAGLGLPLLTGPPFDGLFVEVRFTAAGREGSWPRKGRVHTTLVLVGEVRDGGLALKGVWRSGPSGWEDAVCRDGPWAGEARFLAGLEAFRKAEEVPAGLAKALFLDRGTDRFTRTSLRVAATPLGRPRLGGLLARVVGFAAGFAALGFAIDRALDDQAWLVILILSFPVVWFLFVFLIFVRYEVHLLFPIYRRMRAQFDAFYAEPVRYAAVPRAAADLRFGNPWLRKYTAEAEAAGYAYAGDVASAADNPGTVYRIFHAPDGVTYLVLRFTWATPGGPGVSVRAWPAVVTLQTQTFFPGGGRVECVGSKYAGYVRLTAGPDSVGRVFADVTEPDELLRRHAEAVAEYADRTGSHPLRHESFDRYLRRQEAIHEDERHQYAARPYTRADHLRWYLQWPRRERG
jgi:hypothetical protein